MSTDNILHEHQQRSAQAAQEAQQQREQQEHRQLIADAIKAAFKPVDDALDGISLVADNPATLRQRVEVAVDVIAAALKVTNEHQLLPRLESPPPGLNPDVAEGWSFARSFIDAIANRGEAIRRLEEACRLPTLRRNVSFWLRHGFADQMLGDLPGHVFQQDGAVQRTEPEPANGDLTAAAAGSSAADELKALVAIVGDENTIAIINVAQDKTTSAEERMRAVYAIDSRVLGFTSMKWAGLLRVSDSAVRQTDWWKIDRMRLRG